MGSILGAGVTFLLMRSRTKTVTSTADYDNADDCCLSLYYDTNPAADGAGFSKVGTCSEETKKMMLTVRPEYKRLSADLYAQAVENLPIFCVDVMCRRKSDGKILLFYRRDKPASNIWWWPGGRMYRGKKLYALFATTNGLLLAD